MIAGEIPEHQGQMKLIDILGHIVARKTRFDRAGWAATVAGRGISVLALLRRARDADTIAARGAARAAAVGATRLQRAIRRAAVAEVMISVVASLAALAHPVAANRRLAGRTRDIALKAGFEFAKRIAAITGIGVSVIALFIADDEPVAAARRLAGFARNLAAPTRFGLTGRIAPIAADQVTVVATLRAADHRVPADITSHTCAAVGRTAKTN